VNKENKVKESIVIQEAKTKKPIVKKQHKSICKVKEEKKKTSIIQERMHREGKEYDSWERASLCKYATM